MIASEEKLSKVLIKHGGNQTKAAAELQMSQAAISKRLIQNPELKKKILTAREEAMKKVGLTRPKIYREVSEGLKAKVVYSDPETGVPKISKVPDRKERRESAKIGLQLFRDLDPEYDPQKEKPGIEKHLHLHFEKFTPADLTNLLLGRFDGPEQSDTPKPD